MRNESLNRQWKILHLIHQHRNRGISKIELAKEFGVSSRTIMRDIETLSTSGFPIYDEIDNSRGRQVFYYLNERYTIPEIRFSYTELLAFYLLYTMNSAMNPLPNHALHEVFSKISATIPTNTKKYLQKIQAMLLSDSYPHIRDNQPDKLINILEAIALNKQIQFDYAKKDAVKTFTATPLAIKQYHNNYYLAAFYQKRKTILTYAVNRMQNVTTIDIPTSKIKFDPDAYFNESFGLFSGKAEWVRLQFSAEVKHMILERNWHPQEKITKRKDGSVILEMPVSSLQEAMWLVLSYGSQATVLEPLALRKMVIKELQNALEHYQK